MQALRQNPQVCFELDKSLSYTSTHKSVIAFGEAQIIEDRKEMIPYLQKLIDKYRAPLGFEAYMSKSGRDREREMKAVRICMIKLTKITGKKFVAKQR